MLTIRRNFKGKTRTL